MDKTTEPRCEQCGLTDADCKMEIPPDVVATTICRHCYRWEHETRHETPTPADYPSDDEEG